MKYLIPILFFITTSYNQTTYPRDYFGSPLDIPLLLSGNFGELRPNHFHAGLDFKTQKKEGFNVYATADGYVSRIKIAHGGYGKAIYVTHPNGFTTVYGHLQSGFGKIQNYIIQQQYNLKTYELDINLNPTDLLVKKGEIIAISGNTGGSDGPHLHFEIRDTASEKIINPLFFGFNATIEDTKSPLISTIIGYPIDENSIVNQSKRPIAIGFHLQPDGNYLAEKVIANGRIGFGITTIDYDNVSWNANGIFKIQTYLNGKKNFGFQFDTFAFDETRYINALIDYHRYKTHKQRVQKLFMKNPYDLSIIQTDESNGIIDATSTLPKILKIEVIDYDQNYSKIYIPIEYSNLPAKVQEIPQTSKYHVRANRDNIFSLENVTVTIPSKTFYDDFYMDFEVKNNSIKIHDNIVPAHSSFQIAIEDSISSEKDREKMFIGYFDGKKFNHYTTKRYKNTFSIYSKTLGEYQLLKDTIAPKISMPKKIEGKWISEQENLQLTISDDLSGIKSYEGYLNEKWILLEYENKLNRLTHNFSDGIVAEGKNDLKVVVTDNVGNSTIFETHFYRSQKQ